MQIVIDIQDTATDEIMLAIAAANGWPRNVTTDTVERVTNYMLATVGRWTRDGADILTREATESATVAAISEKVKITVK